MPSGSGDAATWGLYFYIFCGFVFCFTTFRLSCRKGSSHAAWALQTSCRYNWGKPSLWICSQVPLCLALEFRNKSKDKTKQLKTALLLRGLFTEHWQTALNSYLPSQQKFLEEILFLIRSVAFCQWSEKNYNFSIYLWSVKSSFLNLFGIWGFLVCVHTITDSHTLTGTSNTPTGYKIMKNITFRMLHAQQTHVYISCYPHNKQKKKICPSSPKRTAHITLLGLPPCS